MASGEGEEGAVGLWMDGPIGRLEVGRCDDSSEGV